MHKTLGITRADLENLLDRGFRYGVALTHDDMQAEDLVQEACMRMVKMLKPWEPAYFFAIIRNRFIELYRHRKKFPSIPFEEVNAKEVPDEKFLRDAEELTANTESLEKALTNLTAAEREILFLFIIEGYTAKEIAEMIDRPRNSVLSIVYRSRMKLRKILENEQAEVPP
ncbi:MAG: sigma-70 family RNA polymerase sigma factor [Desulfovibrionaceae bacterium]|nr:sigma-70 family RNA polymerase sigma factor [Desulfovibrionaceae bacterium]